MRCSFAARISSGAKLSWRARMSAPISRNGETTRPIGRFCSELSPVNFVVNSWPGQNSRQQAHGRAGIACIQRTPAAFQAAGTVAGDADHVLVLLHVGAERAHARERAVAIDGGGEVAKFAGAFRNSREHGVTVGDGLVAWRLDAAGYVTRRLDSLFFHVRILAWRQRAACHGARCNHDPRAVATSAAINPAIHPRASKRRADAPMFPESYWPPVQFSRDTPSLLRRNIRHLRCVSYLQGEERSCQRAVRLSNLRPRPVMLIAALFVVTVLLAAIPEHRDATGQVVAEPVGDMQSHTSSESEPQSVVVNASAGEAQEAEQNSAAASNTGSHRRESQRTGSGSRYDAAASTRTVRT